MSAPPDPAHLLRLAEAAATAGDFARAAELLTRRLAAQIDGLGAAHPEVASTCNNLAVVHERLGEIDTAETLYRRAYAIAAAAGAGHDALLTEARGNLRDFCRAYGRPFEGQAADGRDPLEAFAPASPPAALPLDAPPAPAPRAAPGTRTGPEPRMGPETRMGPEPSSGAEPSAGPAPSTGPEPRTGPQPYAEPAPARGRPPAAAGAARRAASGPRAAAPPAASVPRGFVAALAAIALVGTAAMFVVWQGQKAQPDSGGPATPAVEPAAPGEPSAAPAPAVVPPPAAPEPAAPRATRAAARPAGGALEVRSTALCRSLDADTATWRCEPLDQPAPPGAVTYLTRVASARTATVRHRWMQDGRVRRVVSLTIGASPGAGYRTFSRQRVTPGRWTVALLDAEDVVLHEATIDVR